MFLITLKKEEGGTKYWTRNYDDKSGYISFETTTKEGKKFTHKINRDVIMEIQDVGELDSDK